MATERPAQQKRQMAAGDLIIIDPDGDLRLVIGPNKVIFLVDASALRRQSRVFKAMLYGGFKEAVQGPEWTVELPEDDAAAFEPIFHIVHANMRRIPYKVYVDDLYDMMVIIDKYDMASCFAERGQQWYNKLIPITCRMRPYFKQVPKFFRALWVANEFGGELHFRNVMEGVTFTVQSDNRGNIVHPRHDHEEVPRTVLGHAPELADDKWLGQ